MVTERRTVIADAAITTLARAGGRGLTHRAVDRQAGLPMGSTSYYFRTRADLLRAAVDRLAELDEAAIAPATAGTLAADLARVLDRLLGADRERLLARYELALESVRRPELRGFLAAGTHRVRGAVEQRLRERGVTSPREVADAALALIDGLLLAELTATEGQQRGRAELEGTLARLVGAE
ncbi:TetR family transcriptional regulator [Verrucosispora sp. WMMA2044]|uniref:TetR/AcrR family transcriptional regulator n=1 Tax=Verrucosispora sioxanthis TaxID=2499994 RepID=A0A6M1KX10_9ACTN|nr:MULTISPECIES: TetR/AcrR family transcriptional regulator [Micromonospora]NEE64306.1 TetR/AcrR family transcriptional regulator [Verrucosispora sioxanthis]NGM13416.1 TetR/AcrR family transcriptional regulator [Verrucosispora sioxanthis]WBB51390.1 TetR family transcriptional regulator [Verrucosispora sp. WMMA2044]